MDDNAGSEIEFTADKRNRLAREKVPRSLEHQHAQHREGGRSQARLGDVPPVLAAGRATSGVCATAVMHAGYGRQTLIGRGPGVSSG